MAQRRIQSNQIGDSGVVPGIYTSANIVVDAAGRILAAADGSGGSSSAPLNEIVYGTGAGITSDAGLTYDSTTDTLTIASSDDGLIAAGAGKSLTLDADDGVSLSSNSITAIESTSDGNAVVGVPSRPGNATTGFVYIPSVATTPSGIPTAITGMSPMVFEPGSDTLWIWNGSIWKSVLLT